MTAKRSDIYGNMTWILQKNSEYDGQFSLIDRVFSLHEHGPAAELRRRQRDFEKTLGSVGGRRHERQCLRHPPAITKGAVSCRDVKNETTSGDVYENTGEDDEMSGTIQGFYTKIQQSHDIRQPSVGFTGRNCISFAIIRGEGGPKIGSSAIGPPEEREPGFRCPDGPLARSSRLWSH